MPDIRVTKSYYGLTVIVTEDWEDMPKEYALSVAAQHLTIMGYGDAHSVSAERTNPHTWTLKYSL
ncbi:MAG: hypothetical protein DRH08_05650 [Deltaproteobacteria bacterium]|nr:MAG: hypothetical protein DRH08_05650 [Deltaproteobacteria bacterium]